KALGELGDVAAVPALNEALKDQNRYVRHNAAEALDGLSPGWDQEIVREGLELLEIADEELNRKAIEVQETVSQDVAKFNSQLASRFVEGQIPRDANGRVLSGEELKVLHSFIPGVEKLTMVVPTVEALKGLVAGILAKEPVYLMGGTGT